MEVHPIAFVKNERKEIEDDFWGTVISCIELADGIPANSLDGIEEFSHLNIIFYMDQVKDEKAVPQCRHPRNNISLPKIGTYAQRNKNRPNKIGLTTVEFIKREGNRVWVKNLDAIDGTPILDVKPVMQEYLPKGTIKQPKWTKEIMRNYWG